MYRTRNFTREEIRCQCKKCKRIARHMLSYQDVERVQHFREVYGVAFKPNSFYRCKYHPAEVKKARPGEHNRGAVDVPARSKSAKYAVVAAAIQCKCTTIIVYKTFVHIDWRKRPAPLLWFKE